MIREVNPESRTFFPSRIPNPDPGSRGQKTQKCTVSWIHYTAKTQTKKWTKHDCSYYKNGSFSPTVNDPILRCGSYRNWSYSATSAPLRPQWKLILFTDSGSTATITRPDPIPRRWLHCGYYKNWYISPINDSTAILFADGGSTAAITWTDPAARQWSRCGQSWWAGSCRRVSRYPVNSTRSVGVRTRTASLQGKNYLQPKPNQFQKDQNYEAEKTYNGNAKYTVMSSLQVTTISR